MGLSAEPLDVVTCLHQRAGCAWSSVLCSLAELRDTLGRRQRQDAWLTLARLAEAAAAPAARAGRSGDALFTGLWGHARGGRLSAAAQGIDDARLAALSMGE